MGPLLEIDTVSQNRLNANKNNEICQISKENGSKVLGVTSGGYSLGHNFRS